MKLKDIKKVINKLTDEELENELFVNRNDMGVSGVVLKITKNKSDLYYTGEDDPAQLYTKKQLKEDLWMDNEEIESCSIEIPKGALVLQF